MPTLIELFRKYEANKLRPEVEHFAACYEMVLAPIRNRAGAILEIGVQHGGSLRAWLDWFPNCHGVGLDDDPGIASLGLLGAVLVVGSQSDASVLAHVATAHGPFLFVCDDGSHKASDQIGTFGALWPFVAPGGVYAIEDTHAAYWPEFRDKGGETAISEIAKPAQDWVNWPAMQHKRADGIWHNSPRYTDVAAVHSFPGLLILTKQEASA